jgi:hypothetical protein
LTAFFLDCEICVAGEHISQQCTYNSTGAVSGICEACQPFTYSEYSISSDNSPNSCSDCTMECTDGFSVINQILIFESPHYFCDN